MGKIGILLVILLFTFLTAVASDESVVECLSVNNNWNRVTGENIWVGYENGGFAMPPSFLYGVVQFENGTELWVYYSRQTPELFYVMPFNRLDKFADANGEHYSVHPCGAFSIDHDSNVYLILSTMSEPTVIYDRYDPGWADRAVKIIREYQWETD